MMLTLYKAARSSSSDSSSDVSSSRKKIIPPGTPYLTKINGKLVMARDKKEKTLNFSTVALDLMGEVFEGRKNRVIRRSKSEDKPKEAFLINGVPYVPATGQPPGIISPAPLPIAAPPSAHLPQNSFPNAIMPGPAPTPPPFLQYYPQTYPQSYLPPGHQYHSQFTQVPQLQLRPQPPTFITPEPTKQDFENLKRFDAHFLSNVEGVYRKPTDSVVEKVASQQTTITITKHVCANCGRLRSRKYHHEHPIKPGEIPVAAFCRKCQKNASSTSGDERSSLRPKKKENKNKSKQTRKPTSKKKQKPLESSSNEDDDDDGSDFPKPERPKNPRPGGRQNEKPILVPAKAPSSARLNYSEDELYQSRGRPRERSAVHGSDSRRALSPLVSQISYYRTRSASRLRRKGRYDLPKNAAAHPKVVESSSGENMPELSPYIKYRYVEIIPEDEEIEGDGKGYSKISPGNQSDEISLPEQRFPAREQEVKNPRVFEDKSATSEIYSIDGIESRDHRQKDYRPSSRDYRQSRSRTSDYKFEDPLDTSLTDEARRRRRRERYPASPSPSKKPWEEPIVINPRPNDVVVVTETFEYRPNSRSEESRRRQERVDRITLDARKSDNSKPFTADEAAKYYQQDWSGPEPEEQQLTVQAPHRRGYRRDNLGDSVLTEAETYEYTIPRGSNSPRQQPQHREYYEEFIVLPNSDYHPTYEAEHQFRPESRTRRYRSGSTHSRGTSFVQDTASSRSRHTLIRSPRPSGELCRNVYDSDISGLTGRERQAEEEARHVTFRNTPSIRSAPWTASEASTASTIAAAESYVDSRNATRSAFT